MFAPPLPFAAAGFALLTITSAWAQDGGRTTPPPPPVPVETSAPAKATPAEAAQPSTTAPAPEKDALAEVGRALDKMQTLQGVEFASTESQDAAMMRQFAQMMGNQEIEVDGKWSPSSLHAFIGDSNEIVIHGSRMVARDDDTVWALRRNCLAQGAPVPFLFDPGRFFEVFKSLPGSQMRTSRHALEGEGDAQRLLVTYEIDGDAANTLLLSGCLPRVDGGMGQIMTIGGMGGDLPPTETTIDLCFRVDLASHVVEGIQVKAYETNPMMGMMQIQGAMGEDEEEQEEPEPVQTKDANGNQLYKQGLPIRQVEDEESVMTFAVRFKNFDKPMRPSLDPATSKLLRLR